MGRAMRDVSIWMRLFRETGLERIDLGFGIDALMLTADLAEPVVALPGRDRRARHEARQAEGMAALIDRLSARLGEDSVRVATPSRAGCPSGPNAGGPARPSAASRGRTPATRGRARPILLLDPPEPVEATAELPDGTPAQFTWRRVLRVSPRRRPRASVARNGGGPRPDDRLARTRDYYRIEDDQGLRYWLFREGLYGSEYTGAKDERPPSWWMHGMFP